MMARSRDSDEKKQKLRIVSLEALEILAQQQFIQPTGL